MVETLFGFGPQTGRPDDEAGPDPLTTELMRLAGREEDEAEPRGQTQVGSQELPGNVRQFVNGFVDRASEVLGGTSEEALRVVDQALLGPFGGPRITEREATPTDDPLTDEIISLAGREEQQFQVEQGPEMLAGAVDADEAAETVRNAAEQLGLDPRQADTFVKGVGQEFATGMALLGSLVLARRPLTSLGTPGAGAGRAERAARAVPRFFGRAGQGARARPGTALATELGASAGIEGAERADLGPVGQFAGALAGGGLAQVPMRFGQRVSSALRTRRTGPDQTFLADQEIDTNRTRLAAQALVKQEMGVIDKVMQRVLDQNQPLAPKRGFHQPVKESIALQEKLGRDLRAAEKSVDGMVSKAWSRAIPKRTQVPREVLEEMQEGVKGSAQEMRRAFDPEAIPSSEVQKLARLGKKPSKKDPNKLVKGPLPRIGKLQNVRSGLQDLIRTGRSREGVRLGQTQLANLQTLVRHIDEAIGQSVPDTAALAAARQLSVRYHDLFTRSALGEAMRRARSGGPRLKPEEVFDFIRKDVGGGQAVADLDSFLKQSAQAEVPEVQRTFEDALRTAWREAAGGLSRNASAQAAESFMKQVRPAATRAVPVFAEMKAATKRLSEMLTRKKEWETGRVARYAEAEPDRAINAVFTDREPAKAAKELMRAMRLAKDQDAIKGFQTLAVDKYLTRNGSSAKRLSEGLDGPDGRVLREVYSQEQMGTLKRIIDSGLRIEEGDAKTIGWASQRVFGIMSKVFGAAFGRAMSGVLGGGTVQTPGIFSRAFGNVAEGVIGLVPPRELIANAVADPNWRKVLFAKLPTNDKEARALLKNLRRGIATAQASEKATEERLLREDQNVAR